MSDLVIRAAVPADIDAIGQLGAQLVRVHHELDRARFLAPTAETAVGYGEYLATQLGKTNTVLLIAERGGAVIGYAWGGLEETDWMALRGPAGALYDIVVDPAARGAGVGRRLLEAALAGLAALGAPRVVLSTAARNDAAQRLFERAGFRRTMIEMTREVRGDAR